MSFTPTLKDPGARAHLRMQIGQPAGVPVGAIAAIIITPRGRVAEVAPLVVAAQHVGNDYAMVSVDGGTDGELYLLETTVADGAGTGGMATVRAEILCLDQSWRVPGASQPAYVDIAGFVARAGLDLAIELTDEEGRGAINGERLEAALADAGALIDSYLAGRYRLPLALPPPAPLPTIAHDLALARLYRHAVPEQVAARATEARRLLADLAAGKSLLAGAAEAATGGAGQVLFQPGDKVFSRTQMGGF